MNRLLTFCTLFAFIFVAHSEVVDLDSSNFDQVIITHVIRYAFH